MTINYITGDATKPIGDGIKIIAHCCNNVGGFGSGFVFALKSAFPVTEKSYREWFYHHNDLDMLTELGYPEFLLGEVQFIKVSDDLYVANMIGQEGISWKDGVPPVRYDAVERCLKRVKTFANHHKATVHMPRICSGLAGGKWDQIEEIINKTLSDVQVTVYDYEDKDSLSYIPWSK